MKNCITGYTYSKLAFQQIIFEAYCITGQIHVKPKLGKAIHEKLRIRPNSSFQQFTKKLLNMPNSHVKPKTGFSLPKELLNRPNSLVKNKAGLSAMHEKIA